jgi:hypothetical protein
VRGDRAGNVLTVKRARAAEAEVAAVVRVGIDAVSVARAIGIADEVVAPDQLTLQIRCSSSTPVSTTATIT